MRCQGCGSKENKVIESRDAGEAIRRRRECLDCGRRFTTYERIERPNLAVIKRDKRRELFDHDKLKRAIWNSIGKFLNRDVEIEEIVAAVEDKIYADHENEVFSQSIGDAVLDELAGRNELAYIRFASVYREFKNADEFVQTLEELRAKNCQIKQSAADSSVKNSDNSPNEKNFPEEKVTKTNSGANKNDNAKEEEQC